MTVYEIIADRIIKELESGRIPWRKPWTGVRTGAYSGATGRPYSLLNQLLLSEPGEYWTYKQVTDKGGTIKKGEKSQMIVFWKWVVVEKEGKDGQKKTETVPYLRYYNVFHINQTEGIEPRYKEAEMPDFNPIEKAEEVMKNYSATNGCPIIVEKGNRAYYSPMLDEIHLPLREQFMESAEFYATAFHEMTHSTGHKSRLDRITDTAHFGNEEYSKEELVAEIGSASLMNTVGIETPSSFKNSAAYCQSWLKALRNDSRMIVSAAGKAEKAVKMILGMEDEKKEESV